MIYFWLSSSLSFCLPLILFSVIHGRITKVGWACFFLETSILHVGRANKRASRVLDTGVTTLIAALLCIPHWAFLHDIKKHLNTHPLSKSLLCGFEPRLRSASLQSSVHEQSLQVYHPFHFFLFSLIFSPYIGLISKEDYKHTPWSWIKSNFPPCM